MTRLSAKSGPRWDARVYAMHAWTGLLFVCCVTGALVVYRSPMRAWANPAIVSTQAGDPSEPGTALARMRAHDPGARVGLFALPNDRYSIDAYVAWVGHPPETATVLGCGQCARTEDTETPEAERRLRQVALANDFVVRRVTQENSGAYPDCIARPR